MLFLFYIHGIIIYACMKKRKKGRHIIIINITILYISNMHWNPIYIRIFYIFVVIVGIILIIIIVINMNKGYYAMRSLSQQASSYENNNNNMFMWYWITQSFVGNHTHTHTYYTCTLRLLLLCYYYLLCIHHNFDYINSVCVIFLSQLEQKNSKKSGATVSFIRIFYQYYIFIFNLNLYDSINAQYSDLFFYLFWWSMARCLVYICGNVGINRIYTIICTFLYKNQIY